MNVKRLVDTANFLNLAREYVEFEIQERNNPLLSKAPEFVYEKNEIGNLIRGSHAAKNLLFFKGVTEKNLEALYFYQVELLESWRKTIEQLVQGICSNIPTSLDEIVLILRGEHDDNYGLNHGEWFDFATCFTKLQPAEASPPPSSYVEVTQSGLRWWLSPREGWVLWSKGEVAKWEYVKELDSHSWLSGKELEKFK